MHALVVDVQNEFGPCGLRTIADHTDAVAAVTQWVASARSSGWPITGVQYHHTPHESRAFIIGRLPRRNRRDAAA